MGGKGKAFEILYHPITILTFVFMDPVWRAEEPSPGCTFSSRIRPKTYILEVELVLLWELYEAP